MVVMTGISLMVMSIIGDVISSGADGVYRRVLRYVDLSHFKSHTLKAYHDQRKAERAQQSDSSSEDDDEVSHGGQQKAQ